jgi:hypothetical protein
VSRQAEPSAPQRPWRLAAVVLAAALALAILNTVQGGIERAYRGEGVPWTGLLKASTVEWLDYALFVLPLWLIVRRYPIDRRSWRVRAPMYLLLGVAVALMKETIYVAVGNVFRPGVFDLGTILSEDFSSELLISWSLIGLVHAAAFYLRWDAVDGRADSGTRGEPLTHIPVRGPYGHAKVAIAEVEVLASEGNYARVETPGGSHLIRHTLSGLERRLDERFLRIHRGIIINLDHVRRFETGTRGEYRIEMRSGARLASARSFNSSVRAARRGKGGAVA